MPDDSTDDLTAYLRRWNEGDRDAADALLPRVYDQLRTIARGRLRAERGDHTLDTSALVHEAYLRLTSGRAPDWNDRAHFFAVISTIMRRVLVDYAKQRASDKRGGDAIRVPIDVSNLQDVALAATGSPDALIVIDDALGRLEASYPRQAKAIELRYFAGLTLVEAAQVLETSAPTVLRDLRFAQAWLARELA